MEPERIPANITLDNLRSFFRGRTHPEGERLASPYIGKWVTIEAKVSQTQLRLPGIGPEPTRCGVFWFNENPFSTTVFLFHQRWKDRIELLRLGDMITVEGRIWIVDERSVELDDRRLIDVKSA